MAPVRIFRRRYRKGSVTTPGETKLPETCCCPFYSGTIPLSTSLNSRDSLREWASFFAPSCFQRKLLVQKHVLRMLLCRRSPAVQRPLSQRRSRPSPQLRETGSVGEALHHHAQAHLRPNNAQVAPTSSSAVVAAASAFFRDRR